MFWLVGLCTLLVGGCNEVNRRDAVPTGTEGGEMVTLSIDFQEGFVDDTIVLQVNGEEVFHKEHISTKLVIGLADSFETEVETGSVNIEINIQTKNVTKNLLLEVSADTNIGISIMNGEIEYIVSDKPFRYG